MVNAQEYLDTNYPKETRSQLNDLDISNRNLEGSLKIIGFTNLRKLNMSFNKITSTIFRVGNSLEEVDLSHNKIGLIGYIDSLSLKKYNFSNNNFEKNTLILPSLNQVDASSNFLVELDIKNVDDLQTLDCSNNLNLVRDKLFLPKNFNPISLNCRNTGLGQIRFSNSSVFDCQTGNLVDTQSRNNELSNSDKIALGTGIGLGVPGLALTAFGCWLAWKQYKRKEKQGRVQTELIVLGEGISRIMK